MGEPRIAQDVIEDVVAVTTVIGECGACLDDAYARRLALFLEGRDMDPPITNRALAVAAGVTEVAIIQACRKHREKTSAE